MKVLVVGLGSIGRRHVANLRKLGVTEISAWRVGGGPFPEPGPWDDVRAHTDLDEALACRPDAAVICNPPACHMAAAIRAARAGCHVFIEKPLSTTLEGVDDLDRLVTEGKLVAFVGFNLRYKPTLRRVSAAVAQGRIGRVLGIQAHVGQYLPDWHPWEDYRSGYSARRGLGGGVILDLIHELDYVRWIAGEVREVACLRGRVSDLEIETEDLAEILLRFDNGAIGSVHLDYLQRAPVRGCRVIGERGTICWDGMADTADVFTVESGAWERWAEGPDERNESFLAEMRHFLACVRGEAAPFVNLAEAARVQRIALAAHESAAEGRVCRI